MQKKMAIEYLPISSLHEYPHNAKKHPDEQVEIIANSIREFGWQQPLVVDKNDVLVIGHGRLLAAKKLGLKTVPVIKAEDLTDEQIRALRLADNKTNESEWDFGILDGELDSILNIDMSNFGFDLFNELEETDGGEIEENEKMPVSVKIVFENSQKWRECEEKVRDFIDTLNHVSVSVNGEYENQESNI